MLKLKTAAAAAALLPRLRFEVAYVKNMPHFLFKLHLQFIAYHTAPGRSASSNKTSIFIFCFCSRYVPCVAQHPDLDSRPNLFLQWLVHKWVLSSYGDAMIMLMGNDPWWWWWSEIWVDRWMRRGRYELLHSLHLHRIKECWAGFYFQTYLQTHLENRRTSKESGSGRVVLQINQE